MTVDSITQQQFVFPGCHNLPPNNGMFTRKQLLEIREQSRRQPIPRVLRKTLFKYNIWHPSVFPVPNDKCNKDKSSTGTKCAVLNSRFINNKEDSIYELIVDNCLDFLALTGTWCNENSTVSLGQITPPGYSVIHTHRPTCGSGVALIFRDTYEAKHVKTEKYTNFENQTVSLSLGTNYLHVTTIYIPSGIFLSEFNEQISDLLSKLLSLTGKHVILGDFNFRINDPTDTHAAKFKALTEQFNLIQHVSIPTHDAGNTLDLVLTRDDLSVSSIFTDHSVKSDHSAVLFTISCASPGVVKKSITYWNGNLLMYHLCELIYRTHSRISHIRISTLPSGLTIQL